jgi:DNA polymerase-3 subunit epsilon
MGSWRFSRPYASRRTPTTGLSDNRKMTTSSPGWYGDPSGRHQLRYFDGARWTEYVADNGVQARDDPSGAPLRQASGSALERASLPSSSVMHRLAGGADRFVIVDVETTGLNDAHRVVEIAVVTMSLTGEILDVFDTLVNPRRDVSATHIHGITASMVRSAPFFEDVAGDVAVRLHGACFVAHKASFDRNMLAREFARCGADLLVVRAIDTLAAAGCGLEVACSQHGISLEGAHRARNDALATAALFLRLVDACDAGAPIAAPMGLIRSGRVCRREDVESVKIDDPPLIVYLASRLPLLGVGTRTLEYLELVGRAMADLHLDRDEIGQLHGFAVELGMTAAEVAQAHRRYVNELVDAAVADSEVTDEEYDALVRVAAALGVEQELVEVRIRPLLGSGLRVALQEGMTVVFTGEHPDYEKDWLKDRAAEVGLVPLSGVTKSTSLVAAVDPASNSGKATQARRYGIPIVSVDDLLGARLGDYIVDHGAGRAALKVITCPDCRTTWTVPATSGTVNSRRCEPCASLEAGRSSAESHQERRAGADPRLEQLTCSDCGRRWERRVARGRKPHLCPECSSVQA